MIELWPRSHVVEHLSSHAIITLRFPRVARALAAFAYGVSPQTELSINLELSCFHAGRGVGVAVPLSRLIQRHDSNVESAHLMHAFAAHSANFPTACTITDLLDDSVAVCHIAGVGRAVKSAISLGGRIAAPSVAREAADRIDVLLLLMAAGAMAPQYRDARNRLKLVHATGANSRGKVAWVSAILGRLGWDVAADVATSVLDAALPPPTSMSARERFTARCHIAQALSDA